jgi:electron transfer flavoprotein alpha subunit
VDRGFISQDRMIGQTGATVRPVLYVAVGISGASQHLTAIHGGPTVIAVNADARAPILKHADFGIIGDVQDVLPPMIAALRRGETIEEYVSSSA